MKALLIVAMLLIPTTAMSRNIPEDLTCSELHVLKERNIIILMKKMFMIGMLSNRTKGVSVEELLEIAEETAVAQYYPHRVLLLTDCPD